MTRRCLLAAVAAAALGAVPAARADAVCPWPDPGRDPYRGDAAAAVERLTAIPEGERRTLAGMVRQRFGGRVVYVGRDQMDDGRLGELRDMNFGAGRVCRGLVDRSSWPAGRHERAVAYVVGRWAVLVFASCNNVAWATNLDALPEPVAPEPSRERLEAARGPVLWFWQEQVPHAEGGQVRHVSEPGGFALAVLACVAAVWARRGR